MGRQNKAGGINERVSASESRPTAAVIEALSLRSLPENKNDNTGNRTVGADIRLSGRSEATFVGFRGRERASIFFKRGREMEYLRRGMVFRRMKPDRSVETAQVLSVILDGLRIPHVRYEVAFRRPGHSGAVSEGPRMLALSAFAEEYMDRAARPK